VTLEALEALVAIVPFVLGAPVFALIAAGVIGDAIATARQARDERRRDRAEGRS